jgi:hypothetical protein
MIAWLTAGLSFVPYKPSTSLFPGVPPGADKKTMCFVTGGEKGRVRVWRGDTATCTYEEPEAGMWRLADWLGGREGAGRRATAEGSCALWEGAGRRATAEGRCALWEGAGRRPTAEGGCALWEGAGRRATAEGGCALW